MLNFKDRRKALGLSQKDMSDNLKISLRTYQRMEKDPKLLSQNDLQKIASIFDVYPVGLSINGNNNVQTAGNSNTVSVLSSKSSHLQELFILIENYATPKLIEEFMEKLIKIKEIHE